MSDANGKENKSQLFLICGMDNKRYVCEKYRVPEKWGLYPKFFGKRKRRGAGDEFYRDEIRASKASIDNVGGGVPDRPQWIY